MHGISTSQCSRPACDCRAPHMADYAHARHSPCAAAGHGQDQLVRARHVGVCGRRTQRRAGRQRQRAWTAGVVTAGDAAAAVGPGFTAPSGHAAGKGLLHASAGTQGGKGCEVQWEGRRPWEGSRAWKGPRAVKCRQCGHCTERPCCRQRPAPRKCRNARRGGARGALGGLQGRAILGNVAHVPSGHAA